MDHDHYEVVVAARISLWRDRLRSTLNRLYGSVVDADEFTERLVARVRQAAEQRPRELRARDAVRELDPQWFHSNDHIGYVAYADRFGGTLAGVADHLDHLSDLDIDYLHLMKVMRARPGANDGGYAIVDYGDVEPTLGSRADLQALVGELHRREMNLCLDLVLNHVAREHPWASAARSGSARHREYFHTFPDRVMPDRYEESLPEVFPQMAPGSFTWDDDLRAWVWTTFNAYQWDLNFSNPDVFEEMLEVILDLANLGIDVLRLDAIAFTWKRMGTNCQNQPEAHLIAQAYRALVAMAAPAVLLKAEAIVSPDDLVPYLGAHRLRRDECQLAYHNQLMVMVWAALATGDARLAGESLAALPPTPSDASWVTYLRCHDDIGWAVTDANAARVGISAPAHRAHLAAFYRGDVPGSFARGAPFATNPDSGDERTVGMTAALCGITAALRGAADLDLGIRRLLLGYGVIMGFGGIPLIYMGDELALGNDESYRDDPAQRTDSRWVHRPFMDWNVVARRARTGTVEERVFTGLRRMIVARRGRPVMSTGGETYVHRYEDPAVLAWERRHPRFGRFFGLANVAPRAASVPAESLEWAGLQDPLIVLGETDVVRYPERVELAPYALAWMVDGADAG